MTTTDKPTKPVAKPTEETIKVRYDFTADDIANLAGELTDSMREQGRLEGELSSIKSEYKGKLESVATRQNVLADKIRNRFEMREIKATVEWDTPKKGMKTYYANNDDSVPIILREEPMTPADIQRAAQRELPLTEEPSLEYPDEYEGKDDDLSDLPSSAEAH